MAELVDRYDPKSFRRVFVDKPEQLSAVVAELGRSAAIGIDLEMVQRPRRQPGGLQEWIQVLALIQMASNDLSVVIDPVRCSDLGPLRGLLSGPVRKVFLGGGQDAALLEQHHIPARNVVDVGEIALALFGRRNDGMAALAQRIFGLSLDKTIRRADWMARPINPVLLEYAYRDAELTSLIYEWLQTHYPEATSAHERLELDPVLPESVAEWVREGVRRSAPDLLVVLMERNLDPARDAEELSADLRVALSSSQSPRQLNRVLRVAAELALSDLAGDVVPYLTSASSTVRTAAARALGRVGEPESSIPLLEPLRVDPVEEVRNAADAAIKELRTPREEPAEETEEDSSSLDGTALASLQRLMEELSKTD